MPYEIILLVLLAVEGLCITAGVVQIHRATHRIEHGYCGKHEIVSIVMGFLTILISSLFITILSVVFWS